MDRVDCRQGDLVRGRPSASALRSANPVASLSRAIFTKAVVTHAKAPVDSSSLLKGRAKPTG